LVAGLALVAPVPVAVDAPASRQGDAVDAAALVRLREALGGTIGLAIRPFLEDMPVYLDELDAAAAAGQGKAMRYTAHAVKGAAGNFGATGLAELARDMEALAEAGQVDGGREFAGAAAGRVRAGQAGAGA
jgi:HPt (histidine-containing phosphotransfer) domain-containing protein